MKHKVNEIVIVNNKCSFKSIVGKVGIINSISPNFIYVFILGDEREFKWALYEDEVSPLTEEIIYEV